MRERLTTIFSGLTTAMRMLTILPIPGKEATRFASCQPWFPVVGALIGGLMALFGWLVVSLTNGWSEVAALAVVGAGAGLTRGLHLDGLSDWADGFWGGYTREKRLSIMKDSCVGAFGVIALVLVLLGKWLALTRTIAAGAWTWIVAACVLSRTMQVVLASAQPYARSEGGTGQAFVTETNGLRTTVTVLVAVPLLLLTTKLSIDFLVVVIGALLLTILFGLWCRRAVGGVTGDLLGTCSEFIELWALLCGGVFAL